MPRYYTNRAGFTLVEMSIVLVIIGLIIGGVLVGRDLINAATVRAQISQIEKYNAAVNTFRNKYGDLPGDLPAASASNFGFTARLGIAGYGDGNGILDSGGAWFATIFSGDNSSPPPEPALFWMDLSQAKLIPASFTWTTTGPGGTFLPSDAAPSAKLGGGNYIYAMGCVWEEPGNPYVVSTNYWGISGLDFSNGGYGAEGQWPYGYPQNVTVVSAYNIDKKIDDGLPQTGRVTASLIGPSNSSYSWVMQDMGPGDTSTATPPSSSSCYDDGGKTGATRHYSITQNQGAGINCGLSIQFQ